MDKIDYVVYSSSNSPTLLIVFVFDHNRHMHHDIFNYLFTMALSLYVN